MFSIVSMRSDQKIEENPILKEEVRSLIARRRRQMLVHSHIYYKLDDNVIDDHLWQKWANELRDLQSQYGEVWEESLDNQFKGWTGDTGAHLKCTPSQTFLAENLVRNQQIEINKKPF